MSSFALGSDPLASMKVSISSSSLSNVSSLPSISTLLLSLSNSLPLSPSPSGDGSHEEGRCEEGPDNGTIDAVQDAAMDGTLDAATDIASDGAADIKTESDRDKWGMALW
jgi:hypothetical protein